MLDFEKSMAILALFRSLFYYICNAQLQKDLNKILNEVIDHYGLTFFC